MIHRPSRRDIVKTTAGLAAAGSSGLRYATRARAQAPASPKAWNVFSDRFDIPRRNERGGSAGNRGLGGDRPWHPL
jgi:hypothetical protein